jgi:hypothetical protein
VVKDPRLGWFFELHRAAAERVGAELHVVTMLRHPADVMRSREIAYGTRMHNTTRLVGWLTMMLGIERRTRDLPRATVRYDDLLTDWKAAFGEADSSLGMGLLQEATPEQVADADALVDPSLHRSSAVWDELGVPSRTLDLVVRAYDVYGRLVGVPEEKQEDTRAELDELQAELTAYYDECFDVARSRTGALSRKERRRAVRRVRTERRAAEEASEGGLVTMAKKARARLRRSS